MGLGKAYPCPGDRTLNIQNNVCYVSVQYCTITDMLRCASQMRETIMNQEKLAKLQAQVRIGGKVRIWCFARVNVV